MPIPTGNWVYSDGDHADAAFVGLPVFSNPLPGVQSQYMLTQELMAYCWGGGSPLALNTPHPDYPTYYLTSETERTDFGCGMVKWKRTYCQVPVARYEASTTIYLYPGLNIAYDTPGTTTILGITARQASNFVVNTKIEYDYFIQSSTIASPDGHIYSDFSLIPVISRQRWLIYVYNGSFQIGIQDVTPPAVYDAGITSLIKAMIPTASQYVAAIGLPFVPGATSAWSMNNNPLTTAQTAGTGTPTGGWFPSVDSQLTRWQGNIFQRVTTYVPVL